MSDTPQTNDSVVDETVGLADHPLTAGRLEKHQRAASAYPSRFERTATAAGLHERFAGLGPAEATGVTATVAGRLVLLRSFGRLVFATLQDGMGRIQLLADESELDDFPAFAELDLGDWVGASGEVVTTKKGELSVRVKDFTLLQKSLRPMPDKYHGLADIELRSRRRYLDLIVNEESRNVALARAAIVSGLRREFEGRGYVEVETPVLTPLATGALAEPFATHHNALDMDIYLRIATELYLKRLIVGGIEKVFEIGRIFRNEGIDSTHNPEFTMLESYEAYADYGDVAVMVEQIFAAIAESVTGSTAITYQGEAIDLSPPYRRVRMADVVAERVGVPVSFEAPLDEVRSLATSHGIEPQAHWGHGKLIEALFDELVADDLVQPTYVMDHPKEVSPLAREHRHDPNLTERWELFIAGSEYANAFSELNDPLDQRRRFEAQAMLRRAGDAEAHPVDEDYLLALEHGMPPTGGLGIGVDRLVMLLTDQHHIRDVILFPLLRPEA
jgi:lysyl-tRNA synthetase class 2